MWDNPLLTTGGESMTNEIGRNVNIREQIKMETPNKFKN